MLEPLNGCPKTERFASQDLWNKFWGQFFSRGHGERGKVYLINAILAPIYLETRSRYFSRKQMRADLILLYSD